MNAVELSSIDLNLLVVLAVVLDEGSVTRAAQRLGRSQSAISHALDRLRALLDDPLVMRSGRGLTTTPRAESLREPLARTLGEVSSLLRRGDAFEPAAAEKRFTLTASDYVQLVLLPPLSAKLRREAPGVSLHVKPPIGPVTQPLASGELDFALLVSLEDHPSLHTRRLFADRFVCLVRDDHPEVGDRLDLETFVRLPHALTSPMGGRGGYVDDALEARGKTRRVAITVPHFLIAPRVVAGSDMVLTLPERVADVVAEGSGLRRVEPPLTIPGVAVHLVWHERMHHDPAHTWLRAKIVEVARALDHGKGDEGASRASVRRRSSPKPPSKGEKRGGGGHRRAARS